MGNASPQPGIDSQGRYTLPEFAAVIPDAVSTGAVERVPVIVIGGGLAGLTAAADLASRGIDVLVLDEDDTVGVRGASSRGMCYAQKTLEVMQGLGVFGAMRAKGIEWAVSRTMAGLDEVYSFDRGKTNVSCQPAFINLQQFYLEWFLVVRLQEIGPRPIRWRNRVTSLTAAPDGVLLSVDTPRGGYRIAADWVIDACGANSLVRKGLRMDPRADQTEDRWCICDVRFKKALPQERWTWVEAPFNEGRAVWQHPMADDVWRLDYQMRPDDPPEVTSRPDVAAARVRAHLGEDVEFEIVWCGPWQYRMQVLESFRHGRVFFVGDSAHVMSPFGARGGNSGVMDAENLAWKLAMVSRGLAPERLLESYDAERRAAALENVETTRRTARFLAPETPFERRLRTATLDLARRYPFARALVNTGRLHVANTYVRSPVIEEGGGICLPNLPLKDSGGKPTCLMDEARRRGAVLLGCFMGMEDAARNREFLAGLRCPSGAVAVLVGCASAAEPVLDAEGVLGRLLGVPQGGFFVIRPDLYCAGVLRQATPAGASRLLMRALGVEI